MRLVTQTDACAVRFGHAEAIRRIARAGFDGIDFSMFDLARESNPLLESDWTSRIDDLLAVARDLDIPFTQAHAPFPGMRPGDDEHNAFMGPRVIRSIEIAGRLGIRAIVIHPFHVAESPEAQEEQNLAYYRSLEPVLRANGVLGAVENLWGHDANRRIVPTIVSHGRDLADFLEKLDSDAFTACLDVGHSGLVGEPADVAVRALGKRHLTTLHIHDNDGKGDQHLLPHLGVIDWDALMTALAEIDYQGDFTLESDRFLLNQPDANMDRALAFMEATGRALMRRIAEQRPV